MRLALIFSAAMATQTAAQMPDLATMQLAQDLGTILAAEQLCGLTYDAQAIETWIAANVAADNMSFASTLQTMTMAAEYTAADMTAGAKVAHCAAIRQSATHLGFVR